MASANFDENELRVMLKGNTGSGKSRLAQNIAGSNEENYFDDGLKTSVVKQRSCCRFGHYLNVIDTPGYKDEKSFEKDLDIYVENSHSGPHVFLICLPVVRCTEDINQMLDEYVRFFGKNIFGFTIFVFTHIDQWNDDMEELGCSIDFTQYIDSLSEHIKLFNSVFRYCKINNRLKGSENENQIKQLVDKIEDLVTLNSNASFEKYVEPFLVRTVKWATRKVYQKSCEVLSSMSGNQ
ncbi:unnamed protein product [Mytilus edulis]|uniref:AIG1-type G domain-containing protein n=1 Tax=Mytilus edulis TaxID=6550 RepID=A0A8S3V1L3_MYTED|nr:unnamed protein product [Mytilus edulis]